LSVTNAFPGGSTHLPAFGCCRFRRGGSLGTATEEHVAEFGNLRVDSELLLFKTFDRCGDDFGSECSCGHMNQSDSIGFVAP